MKILVVILSCLAAVSAGGGSGYLPRGFSGAHNGGFGGSVYRHDSGGHGSFPPTSAVVHVPLGGSYGGITDKYAGGSGVVWAGKSVGAGRNYNSARSFGGSGFGGTGASAGKPFGGLGRLGGYGSGSNGGWPQKSYGGFGGHGANYAGNAVYGSGGAAGWADKSYGGPGSQSAGYGGNDGYGHGSSSASFSASTGWWKK